MPFPIIAALASKIGGKVAAKGALEAGAKGAAKAGAKGAAKAGSKNFAQKAMGKISNFEGKNWDAARKSHSSGGQQDSPGIEAKDRKSTRLNSSHLGISY